MASKRSTIATIGEALVDMIEQADGSYQACLGGSVSNFTLALARQGILTTYLNRLSEDRLGQLFAQRLQEAGVLLGTSIRSACATSIAMVSISPEGGEPHYTFYRQDVADRDISAELLVASFPDQLRLLHTGGLALVPDDLQKVLTTMRAATNRGALVSVDANLRPAAVKHREAYIEGVKRALRQAHIIKVSDDDLDILGLGKKSLSELSAYLFSDSHIQLIAVTRGANPAALITRACTVEYALMKPIQVVDAVGAGDCFHAGLIAYLHRCGHLDSPESLEELNPDFLRAALRHAMAAASVNIQRVGCQPASWEETAEFSKGH
jgi:fructokinase